MDELSTKDRVMVVVAVVVCVVVLALAWALPEDHTTDYLYRPVAETRA